jgi:hypothetical protein
LLWGEIQDVLVINGIYNVTLGQGTPITGFGPLEPALFSEDDRWLQVFVNGEELTPRRKITSVPYAFQAHETDPTVNSDVKDGVSWNEIAGIPPDIADGDAQGIAVETDPTVNSSVKDGVSWGEVTNIPADIKDGDQGLTEELDPTVPSSVKDGIDWSELTGIPPGFSDGVDNVSSGGTSDGHSLDAADGLPVDALYVNNEGNVGIGNVAPVAPLSVGTQTTGGNVYIGAVDSANEGAEIAWEGAGDYTNWITDVFQNNFRLWNLSLTPNRLEIYNLNPLAPTGLFVQGNASFGTINQIGTLTMSSNVTDNAGSYTNGLVFANHSFMPELGSWTHAAIWTDGKTGYSGELVFGTDGDGGRNTTGIQERMRITKDGFVGIGTSTPEYVLDVYGVIKGRGLIQSEIIYAENTHSGTVGKLADFQFGVYGSNTGAGINTYAGFFDGPVKIQGVNTVEVLEITGGADLSERFDIKESREHLLARAGMVVSIDSENPGELKISKVSYDRKVAGIISGAGGVNPGMLMGQEGTNADGAIPVALTGRVYAMADASYGSIGAGDLLTTSDTPGHAMKVTDYARAQGAIIGKAMSSLEKDTGLVLVLVSLQ